MNRLDIVFEKMIEYYRGDAKRIQHFTKVHSYAALIGRCEGLDAAMQETLEAAAFVHDIGIKPAEEKYGDCCGKNQEKEGPAPARALLLACGYEEAIIERVAFLVAHHHTYHGIDGVDYQILVEADFLVNLYEDEIPEEGVAAAYRNVFKTKTGKTLCRTMFNFD